MIYAATGHRPDELGGYESEAQRRVALFAKDVLTGIQMGPESKRATKMISGMALGWDTAIALAALELKVPLECAIPFRGQEEKWPEPAQRIYRDILRRAIKVNYLAAPGYAPWKLHNRNYWMANNAQTMLALWRGKQVGGTAHCIEQANKLGRPIINVWDRWERYADTNPAGRLKPGTAAPAWRREG